MRQKASILIVIMASLGLSVRAGELSPDVLAKFIKIAASDGKVSCKDAGLKSALESAGVVVDAGAKIIWCTNANEIKMAKMQGKLSVVGRPELMGAGGGIGLLDDGGKPKIVVNKALVTASGVAVSPMLFKVGEVQ